MALDVGLLRTSFDLVLERNPNLTARFYDVLFARHPEVKPLFVRTGRQEQEAMLAQALVSVMDHLEDAPWLAQTLGALGERHTGYGVTPIMYDWVGDALIATLAESAGRDWTQEMNKQWTAAFGAIASMMCPSRA